MDVTRTDVMAVVSRLRWAADHLEAAEHVEEAIEAGQAAQAAADEVTRLFRTAATGSR